MRWPRGKCGLQGLGTLPTCGKKGRRKKVELQQVSGWGAVWKNTNAELWDRAEPSADGCALPACPIKPAVFAFNLPFIHLLTCTPIPFLRVLA